nr:hypothetical protein [uncultured Roseibium sp.]
MAKWASIHVEEFDPGLATSNPTNFGVKTQSAAFNFNCDTLPGLKPLGIRGKAASTHADIFHNARTVRSFLLEQPGPLAPFAGENPRFFQEFLFRRIQVVSPEMHCGE